MPRVTALREQYAAWLAETDEAELAAICAMYDGYSEGNVGLIAMQCSERGWTATDVGLPGMAGTRAAGPQGRDGLQDSRAVVRCR